MSEYIEKQNNLNTNLDSSSKKKKLLKMEGIPGVDEPTPKVITFVQNYISPLNAMYIFPVTIAAALDIMSPFGPMLIIAAVSVGILYLFYRHKWKKSKESGTPIKKTTLILLAFTFLIFSASALANFNSRSTGGLIANWIPKVKTWQDAYLVSIKEDTDFIKRETINNSQKIDEANDMLKQMLASFKPQLEKPLVEQIPDYHELAENEQNALMLLTSKVGVNGIKKYNSLINSVNHYTANKTPENARAVAENFTYIVRVNGKDIEDTKTKKTLMALFLDPETYAYIMGSGIIPSNTDLLEELNINISGGLASILEDPLGDFIRQLEANGEPIIEEVVIPSSQVVNIIMGNPDLTNHLADMEAQAALAAQKAKEVVPPKKVKPRTNNTPRRALTL